MLYSVLDCKAHCFGPIVASRSDEEAIRSFLITIQNSPKNDIIGMCPQDFSLFRLGDYDEKTGSIIPESNPYQLITGIECLQMISCSDTSSEVGVRKVRNCLNDNVADQATDEEVGA